MNTKVSLFISAILMAHSASAQVTTDIWDVAQGTVVLSSSGGFALNNIFGAQDFHPEPGNATFSDNQPAGFTHFIEWTTPSLISLTGFRFYTFDDGSANAGDRGITQFRLYSRPDSASAFSLINTYNAPTTHPYGTLDVPVTFGTPIMAKEFRAEFDQYAPSSFPGPRVQELDGFGTVVPEPASGILLLLGAALCSRRRSLRTHERIAS